MNKQSITLLLMLTVASVGYGQKTVERQPIFQTFKDTRVINAHSVETLKAGHLDFRVGHRFGDIAGAAGGWPTFYGLESASDVMIGFEYGVSDRLMIGISRTSGGLSALNDSLPNGNLNSVALPGANINGLVKYRLATQDNVGTPFSLALLGHMTASTDEKSSSESDLTFFEKTEHRFSYHAEFMIAKKWSNYLSLQLSGAWTYRNIVPNTSSINGIADKNDIVSLGLTARIQMNKALALILDGRYAFSELRVADNGYYAPVGIGLEWETGGGHVFQINLTNATGLVETDYIPYTRSNWLDGEYRLGFTIARQFRI